MKNKKLLYVLIPSVIILWGVIIYKVLSGAAYEDTIMTDVTSGNSIAISAADTFFTIKADYADPFLKKYVPRNTSSNTELSGETRRPVPAAPPPRPVNWPEITYAGKIENNSSKTGTYLISVNRQNYLMGINNEAAGITLAKAWDDSVVVSMLGQVKTIYRLR